MFKKTLFLILFFVCLFAFAACAGAAGPQGQKGDTGPQGPAGPQGPKGQDGVAVTNTVYHVGDEVTVSQNGYALFKFKVTSAQNVGGSLFVVKITVTNINMPFSNCSDYIAVSYYYSDNTSASDNSPSSDIVHQGESGTLTFGINSSKTVTKIYFGFPNSTKAPFIPYAVFQV